MDFNELRAAAEKVLHPRHIGSSIEAGGVAAALVTDTGKVFCGVCIDMDCSIGFCAEHSAIAAMITAGESRVEKIVAIDWHKKPMPPCGRCRELLMQLGNPDCEVMVREGVVVPLKDLMPHYWQEGYEYPVAE